MSERNSHKKNAGKSSFLSFLIQGAFAHLVVNHGGKLVAITFLLLGFIAWNRTIGKDAYPLVLAQTGAMEVVSTIPASKRNEPDKPFLELLIQPMTWALDSLWSITLSNDPLDPYLPANQQKENESENKTHSLYDTPSPFPRTGQVSHQYDPSSPLRRSSDDSAPFPAPRNESRSGVKELPSALEAKKLTEGDNTLTIPTPAQRDDPIFNAMQLQKEIERQTLPRATSKPKPEP